jgi:O-methyltransferase involved in polyketide biosynthesis
LRAYLAPVRTDNHTWGITTSVGSTALFVAAARALEAQKTKPLAYFDGYLATPPTPVCARW